MGFEGAIKVFTVVLSALRTEHQQRHSARGGRRE